MVLIVRTQDSKFCFLWNGDIKGSVMLTGGAAAGLRVIQLHSRSARCLGALLGRWTADKFLIEAAREIFSVQSYHNLHVQELVSHW